MLLLLWIAVVVSLVELSPLRSPAVAVQAIEICSTANIKNLQIQSAVDFYNPQGYHGSDVWMNTNDLYVFGGVQQTGVFVVKKYDMTTKKWTHIEETSPSLPVHAGGGFHAFKVTSTQIFLFGGMDHSQKISQSTYSFDTTSLEWASVATNTVSDATFGRSHFILAQVRGRGRNMSMCICIYLYVLQNFC